MGSVVRWNGTLRQASFISLWRDVAWLQLYGGYSLGTLDFVLKKPGSEKKPPRPSGVGGQKVHIYKYASHLIAIAR